MVIWSYTTKLSMKNQLCLLTTWVRKVISQNPWTKWNSNMSPTKQKKSKQFCPVELSKHVPRAFKNVMSQKTRLKFFFPQDRGLPSFAGFSFCPLSCFYLVRYYSSSTLSNGNIESWKFLWRRRRRLPWLFYSYFENETNPKQNLFVYSWKLLILLIL